MSYYHWLGIDAEPSMDERMEAAWREMNRRAHDDFMGLSLQAATAPLADEDAQYIIEDHPDGGLTASLIEDDGFVTIWPTLETNQG